MPRKDEVERRGPEQQIATYQRETVMNRDI
jgi:hypothetical protein